MRRGFRRRFQSFAVATAVALSGGFASADGASTVTFWGGAECVGGSCALVERDAKRVMVDCGTTYADEPANPSDVRLPRFAFDPSSVSDVLVTHAHQDHAGHLPSLIRSGFAGTVWMTAPTKELLAVIWRKQIMYEDADIVWQWSGRSRNKSYKTVHWRNDCEYAQKIAAANRQTHCGRYSALEKLFQTNGVLRVSLSLCQTCQRLEVESVMRHVRTVAFDEKLRLGPFEIAFRPVKHLPGAAATVFSDGAASWVFSGDLGTLRSRLVDRIDPVGKADAVFVETTYGDEGRDNDADEVGRHFQSRVGEITGKNGLAWIPCFALDRSFRVLVEIQLGMAAGRIDPETPVYFLSSTARQLAKAYVDHPEWFDNAHAAGARGLLERCRTRFDAKGYAGGRGILLTTSGMMDAGFSCAFLPYLVPRSDVTVCLVGYQSPGTHGCRLRDGVKSLTVMRDGMPRRVKVGCATECFGGFSGHADAREVERWLANNWKSKIYLVHGDASALKQRKAGLETRFGADVEIVRPGKRYEVRSSATQPGCR